MSEKQELQVNAKALPLLVGVSSPCWRWCLWPQSGVRTSWATLRVWARSWHRSPGLSWPCPRICGSPRCWWRCRFPRTEAHTKFGMKGAGLSGSTGWNEAHPFAGNTERRPLLEDSGLHRHAHHDGISGVEDKLGKNSQLGWKHGDVPEKHAVKRL